MLYPLSYEGGEVLVQVRGYLRRRVRRCPRSLCPRRARSSREQRFSEPCVTRDASVLVHALRDSSRPGEMGVVSRDVWLGRV